MLESLSLRDLETGKDPPEGKQKKNLYNGHSKKKKDNRVPYWKRMQPNVHWNSGVDKAFNSTLVV